MENKPASEEVAKVEFKPWEQFAQNSEKFTSKQVDANGEIPPWIAIQNNIASGAAFLRNVTMPPSMSKNVYKYDGKQAAKEMGFEQVFANLIQAESRGRHTDASGALTTSPVGAKGVTQVMPKTAKDPGYGVSPIKDSSEGEYLRFGREYLGAMVKEFNGDYRKALAAYNYGPGSVRKAIMKAAKAGHEDWLSLTPKETQNYVSKILRGGKIVQRERGNVPSSDRDVASLDSLIKQASSNEDFSTLSQFLEGRKATPTLKMGADGSYGMFSYNLDERDSPGEVGLAGSNFFTNGKPTPEAMSTLVHEFTHAADRQISQIASEIRNSREKTPQEQKFLDTYRKLHSQTIGEGGRVAVKDLAKLLNREWFDKNTDYRTTEGELRAFGVGNQVPGSRERGGPPHLDSTAATEFMMLVRMAKDLKKRK